MISGMETLTRWLRIPLGKWVVAALSLILVAAAAIPLSVPLRYYRVHSDDFKYIADSRTWERTIAHLYVPHNTHIVPAWRLVAFFASAAAGSLANLQTRLAGFTFAILAVVMLLVARLVANETRKPAAGLIAMAALGLSSLMNSSGTWFASSQTLWASFGILLALWSTQGYRQRGGDWRIGCACAASWLAGGMWTVGHLSGVIASVDLWADGRSQCRRRAIAPVAVSVASAVMALALGASRIDGRVSFHGRTSREALNIPMGVSHTLQSIPETLMLGNLGLKAPTTPSQGVILCTVIALVWMWSLGRRARPAPLELAGGTMVVSTYVLEWIFRGYLPFTSLRQVVPWYDTMPDVGFILFLGGICSRGSAAGEAPAMRPLTIGQALGVVAFAGGFLLLHQPRTDELLLARVPELRADEKEFYLTDELKKLRAIAYCEFLADDQRNHFARLDRLESAARRLGIGLDSVRQAFGRLAAPECPEVYDAADLLALPERGHKLESSYVRAILRPLATVREREFPSPERIAPVHGR
jgi:hypothetical protein